MRISELEGRRVALWGFGREGQAALDAIRRRQPQLPLTLFCSEARRLARARGWMIVWTFAPVSTKRSWLRSRSW